MDSYRWFLVALAGLMLAGCHGGVETDVLERELRVQEDHIYALQDKIDEYRTALESCRRSNQKLPRPVGSGETAEPWDSVPGEPPVVQPGIPTGPPNDEIPGDEIPGGEIPGGSGALPSLGDRLTGDRRFAPGGPVQKIVLNRLLSGGLDIDGRPGDEGITAVIEPRDERGHMVTASGQVSLMVIDPNRTGPQAQIARWDFTPEEVARRWRSSALAKGVHFELPWPFDTPPSGPLMLWARLVTADGRKLLTNAEIDVETTSRSVQASLPSVAVSPKPSDSFAARSAEKRWSQRWAQSASDRASTPARFSPAAGLQSEPLRSEAFTRTSRPPLSRPEWQPFR